MRILKKRPELRFLLHIGQLFIYTITADILLSEIAFILGRSISWYTLPVSFLAGLLCLVHFYGEEPGRQVVYEAAVAVFLFIFLTGLCGKVLDFSYDGNGYHKVAVGLLTNHWNPIWQLPEQVAPNVIRTGLIWGIWVECYAKGAWIFAAGVYGITGNIECGKVYTLIGMTCAFLLTYYCMRSRKKGRVFALFFAVAAASNPIAVQQMRSFYVDGYLHIMLYILILSLIMMLCQEKDRTEKLIFASIMVCAMIICGTIKFTGLLYAGIYCIGYFLYYCYCQIRDSNPKRRANIGKCFVSFALLAAVTVLWAGADTYVINMIRHGSPVYPLYGKGAVDIVTSNSAFGEVNRVKNLLISLFSKVDNPFFVQGGAPQLKAPFTVDWSTEPSYAHGIDSRISGFGVFFSGLLIIAAISIMIRVVNSAIRRKSGAKGGKIPFWAAILVINIGLCFAITESWWARYAPYIYFTVLMGAFFLWDVFLEAKGQMVKKCAGILLFLLFLSNSLICLHGIKGDFQLSAAIRAELQNLKSYAAVKIDANNFFGIYFNLKDQGVYYIPSNDLRSSETGIPLPYMGMQVLPE